MSLTLLTVYCKETLRMTVTQTLDIMWSCLSWYVTNAVSVLTSVRFCFWMFDGQRECVSNLTAKLLFWVFWRGQGPIQTGGCIPRIPSSDSWLNFLILIFFNLFCCHFNSMSHRDWDGSNQSGRSSLWPSVQSHHPVKCCLNHTVIVLSLAVFKGFNVQKQSQEALRFYTNVADKDWEYIYNIYIIYN